MRRLSLAAFLAAVVTAPASAAPPLILPAPVPYQLGGTWKAAFTFGAVRMRVTQSGTRFVAVQLDTNTYIPAGTVAVTGTVTGRTFAIQERCAYPGYRAPYWVRGTMTVEPSGRLTERYANCNGSPVRWTRILVAPTVAPSPTGAGGGSSGVPPVKPCYVNSGALAAVGPCFGPVGQAISVTELQPMADPPYQLRFERVPVNGVKSVVLAPISGPTGARGATAPAELCIGPGFPKKWSVWLIDGHGALRGEIGEFTATGCP